MNTDAALTARLHSIGARLADANGQTVALTLSGAAYTSRSFDRLYDEHAARIGYRPAFSVIVALGDGMEVRTTPADEAHARELAAALEATVAR